MSDETADGAKSSLKHQLKAWRDDANADGEELPDLQGAAKPDKPGKPDGAALAAARREQEDREAALSDEELFQRAVEGVTDDAAAMLGKYDRSDDPVQKKATQAANEQAPQDADLALFLQAVGDMTEPPKD